MSVENTSNVDLNNLPQWDLTDLYDSTNDPKITDDIASLTILAKLFEQQHKGKLEKISGDDLNVAIKQFEDMSELMTKIMSFAGLLFAIKSTDTDTGVFYQNMTDELTTVGSHLLFFGLEINKLEDDVLLDKFKSSSDLEYFKTWLNDSRASRQYQLSDEVEEILHEKSSTGRMAWTRLFNQTMAGLKFNVDGEELNESQVLTLMGDKDSTKRKSATLEMARVLEKNMTTLSLITNTLAKDKEVSDRFRGFSTPVSSRNLNNLVEDEVIDALVDAVKDSYSDISHRYYKLKAKWMGVEKLNMWDRNAPLPQDDDSIIDYDDAVKTVLSAYNNFSPKLHSVAKNFFENDWIDVGVRDGKRSGAFAHPCVPSVHPYLMLNYQGKIRDVMTLAHELGHGCHQILASKQGFLKSQTPLTLAETASVFGEMLTFRKIINNESDPVKRRILLAGKVEDMINTVVRQIAFFEFERLVHDNRKNGELSPEQLGEFWLKVSKDSLGDAFIYDDYYKNFWGYIPHFIHSPFYVYSYAFGDCLVNAIYSLYQDGFENFEEVYIDMLTSGGTKRHKELLAGFGLDASHSDFWKKGLSVIGGFIDELESTF